MRRPTRYEIIQDLRRIELLQRLREMNPLLADEIERREAEPWYLLLFVPHVVAAILAVQYWFVPTFDIPGQWAPVAFIARVYGKMWSSGVRAASDVLFNRITPFVNLNLVLGVLLVTVALVAVVLLLGRSWRTRNIALAILYSPVLFVVCIDRITAIMDWLFARL